MGFSFWQHLSIIVLVIFILQILNIIRSRTRGKKARDVEFSLVYFETKDSKLKTIGLGVPFQDRGNGFDLIIGHNRKDGKFDPGEAMYGIISGLFPDKYLVQVIVNSTAFPSNEYLNSIDIHPFQLGIRNSNNVLIHTPESLAKGSLYRTLTNGADGFMICDDISDERMQALGDFLGDLELDVSLDVEKSIEEIFEYEGFLMRDYRGWKLDHADDAVLIRFANAIIHLASENTLYLNNIDFKLVSPVFDVTEISEQFSKYKKKELLCHIYIEDSNLVFFWRKGKKAGSQARALPSELIDSARIAKPLGLRDYLIPQKVEYRAYARKNLLRFSLQYLLATAYLYGASFIVDYLAPQRPFGVEPPAIVIGVCVVCWFIGFLTFIMSFVYLVKALFSRTSIIHPVA